MTQIDISSDDQENSDLIANQNIKNGNLTLPIFIWVFFVVVFAFISVVLYFQSKEFVSKILDNQYRSILQNSAELISRDLDEKKNKLKEIVDTFAKADTGQPFTIHSDKFRYAVFLQQFNNQWQSQILTSDHSISSELQPRFLDTFVSTHIAQNSKIYEEIVLVTDNSFVSPDKPVSFDFVNTKPFFMIASTFDYAPYSYLVVSERLERIFSNNWLKNNNFANFTIRNADTGDVLYTLKTQSASKTLHKPSSHFDFDILNTRLRIEANFSSTPYTVLLNQLPPSIMVISVILFVLFNIIFGHSTRNIYLHHQKSKTLSNISKNMQTKVRDLNVLSERTQETEAGHLQLLNAMNDIVFETDEHGHVIFLSDAWVKITGTNIDTALHTTISTLFHDEDAEKIEQEFNAIVTKKKDIHHIYARLKTAHGKHKSTTLSIALITEDHAKKRRIIGTIANIEQRTQAEKALRDAERNYRHLVENAANGLFQLLPSGVYKSANPAMANILGYKSSQDFIDTIKHSNGELYVDTNARQKMLREAGLIGELNNRESLVYQKNGSTLWINENLKAIKDDIGDILYYEGSVEDITDRKENQIALQNAKKQSDLANRAKSEFLSNMSHELRTPLNSIIGFSDVIRQESLGALDNNSYKDYAEDIHKSGRNLLKFINEILDISKIETKERQLMEIELNLKPIIENCIVLMKSKIESKNLILQDQCNNLPDMVAEAVALKQITTNMLSNAIKFTPDGGTITLKTFLNADNEIILSITDTGSGLNHDEIEQALSPFGQTDEDNHSDQTSTGLGLTLSQALIELHNGKFDMISQRGVGTTVTITFPATRTIIPKQHRNSDQPSTV